MVQRIEDVDPTYVDHRKTFGDGLSVPELPSLGLASKIKTIIAIVAVIVGVGLIIGIVVYIVKCRKAAKDNSLSG